MLEYLADFLLKFVKDLRLLWIAVLDLADYITLFFQQALVSIDDGFLLPVA